MEYNSPVTEFKKCLGSGSRTQKSLIALTNASLCPKSWNLTVAMYTFLSLFATFMGGWINQK